MDTPAYHVMNVYWGNSPFKTQRKLGPCYITTAGTVYFSRIKKFASRENGPVFISSEGKIIYRVKGKLHRTTGPAIIWDDGTREYWVNSEQIEPVEFYLKYGVL